LQVRYAESKKDENEPKLFVGMLPAGYTESDLEKLFSTYGEILLVHIMKDSSGQLKSFFHILFFIFFFFLFFLVVFLIVSSISIYY
jgi:RNA recognition motif-containing protein